MQLQFHGAVRTVTGSQHLLTVNGKRILLDCGLYQGKRKEGIERNRNLPFDASSIDLMILSHAHIDHSGNIPNLVKSGYRGDIICTYATRDLCTIMLKDSAKIQESDARYVNRKLRKKGLPADAEPIYSQRDVMETLKLFLGMAYERTREVLPGVHLTFFDAGHILGSAIVVLDIEDYEGKRDVRLVFSGDIGRPNRPILRDPSFVDSADILLVESTYGNREHKKDAIDDSELKIVIEEAVAKGGKIIVPAFAVGRTQELVYRIHRLRKAGELSTEIPIFVDSPLAINATSVYRLHPEGYDEEIYDFMMNIRGSDPFGFERMNYTRTVEQSKAINDINGPAVIISASGMAESGRILHHLKNNVEDPRNTVLIVGWQAPHTLGRRIAEKQTDLRIFGQRYKRKAKVCTINGFSGHADRSELLEWTGHLKNPPKHTFIVHGEEAAALDFAKALKTQQGHEHVVVPHLHQKFQV
ncbi:MAG: MBL fold metallo-hydrolase RNA specificity domain-containing protein [Candidatus Promineifilaceae bacterium]